MSKPKVSVVLPVYNAQKTLEEALESLFAQTFTKFEVICINDGSTDASWALLEKKAQGEKRLRLFSTENHGAGAARNEGLAKARGEYVFFMDADDVVTPDFLEKAFEVAKARKAQLLLFDTGLLFQNGQRQKRESSVFFLRQKETFSISSLTMEDKDDFFLVSSLVPWNKLFERAFLQKNKILFDTCRTAEDIAFSLITYGLAERIAYLPETFYYYRIGQKHSLSTYRPKDLLKGIEAFEKAERRLGASLSFPLVRRALFQYVSWLRSFISTYPVGDFYALVQEKIKKAAQDNPDRLFARMDKSFFDTVANHPYLQTKYFIKDFALTPVSSPLFTLRKMSAFFRLLPMTLLKNHRQAQKLFSFKKTLRPIEPLPHPNTVVLALAADAAYVAPLSVTLQSLLETARADFFYDVVILERDLTPAQKEKLQKQVQGHPSFSVRFWNTDALVRTLGESIFYASAHISMTAYYRLFIPLIFKAYDKVLYLDSDLVLLRDVADLYHEKLADKWIGCVQDFKLIKELYNPLYSQFKTLRPYLENILQLKHPEHYFNSGVLLMNTKRLRQTDFVSKAIFKLWRLKTPLYHDQDILNALCQGQVKFLSSSWNFCWHTNKDGRLYELLPPSVYRAYVEGEKNPFIIHYASVKKPWNASLKPALSAVFWQYAQRCPFAADLKVLCSQPPSQSAE